MTKVKQHLKENWRRYALTGAGLAATYYGGPQARDAVYQYLPALCVAFGLC